MLDRTQRDRAIVQGAPFKLYVSPSNKVPSKTNRKHILSSKVITLPITFNALSTPLSQHSICNTNGQIFSIRDSLGSSIMLKRSQIKARRWSWSSGQRCRCEVRNEKYGVKSGFWQGSKCWQRQRKIHTMRLQCSAVKLSWYISTR